MLVKLGKRARLHCDALLRYRGRLREHLGRVAVSAPERRPPIGAARAVGFLLYDQPSQTLERRVDSAERGRLQLPRIHAAHLVILVKRRAKRSVAPSAARGTIGPRAIISAGAHEIVAITVGAWQIAVASVSGRLRAAEHAYSERKSHAKKDLSAHCQTLQCPLLGSPNLTLTLNSQTPSSTPLRKLKRGEPYSFFRNCSAIPSLPAGTCHLASAARVRNADCRGQSEAPMGPRRVRSPRSLSR